jgi:hypothetical protein
MRAVVPPDRHVDQTVRTTVMLKGACLVAAVAVTGLALLPCASVATPLCRWVDESGRTQISDVVPERYRKAATCTDSQAYELTPEQRREAERRAAELKARAQRQAAATPDAQASGASAPAAAASRPQAKRPARTVDDSTDCATWWRIFDESAECFGPFRTTRGAVKPEAFEHCNVVPSPELKCGPRRN